MSYCRFSTDNFKSDVYVYQGNMFVIHVAGNRLLFRPIPELGLSLSNSLSRWAGGKFTKDSNGLWKITYSNEFKRCIIQAWFWFTTKFNRLHSCSLRFIPRVNIDLPYAGETFNSDTAQKCLDNLLMLRKLMYNIPDKVLNSLNLEIKDKNV